MKSVTSLVVLALACAPLACGSPGATADGGRGGAEGGPDGAPDGGPDTPADLADLGEVSDVAEPEVQRTGLPLPATLAPPLRLLDDTDTLTGAGRTSCSHQEPASGDGHRWCAFRRPHAGGGTELWVFDLSAAASGAAPVCDGTDARCLRLSTTLWPSYGNDFEGDTLVFYSDAAPLLKTSEPFVGPVSAWRPGWAAPRVIAPKASVCGAHRAAAVAVCFDDPRGNPNDPDDVLLRVGALVDAAPGTLPALPGRWPLKGDGSVPWQLGFSPDGETFAVSIPDVTPFVQNLSVIATREVGTGDLRRNVVSDLALWRISNDGSKLFFLRGPAADATLAMVDFPAGTNETALATKVVEFVPLGRAPTDLALLLRLRQDVGGHAFQLLRDRARPEGAVTVFTNEGFLEGLAVSPDLRYTAWLDPEFRGQVVRVSDLASCAMNPEPAPEVGELGFLDDASYMFWSEPEPGMHSRRDGYLAPPDRCAERTRFAVGLSFTAAVGSRGLVYGDEHDGDTQTVTLKYATLTHGPDAEAAAGGVRVHERVTAPVTVVDGATGPGSAHVVYRAEAAGARAAGVYVFGPLPF